jgi:F-type H+-transporting ATPase subunit beta
LERFLTQPFATVSASTGAGGKLVPLDATLKGCETILSQDSFERPESDYYMIGALPETEVAA